MADQTQFRHITVNAADDDVVIYAGAHESAGEASEARAHAADPLSEPAQPTVKASEACEELQPREADDYHETTLADIRASKMPAMQKAIIAIAVVAIAAFAVWYMFFH